MYLHLGQGNLVYQRDVIGIFAVNHQTTQDNLQLIDALEWGGSLVKIMGETRSIVVTTKKSYFCPLATATLEKRWRKQHLNF